MLRLASAVSAYPFYNFRYLKLLHAFARRFVVYCFAGSRIGREPKPAYVRYVLPFTVPRRIMYMAGPFLSQLWINSVEHDVVWLFDTAAPFYPVFFRKPVVVDAEDTALVLPKRNSSNKVAKLKELKLFTDRRVMKVVVTTEIIRQKLLRMGIDEEKVEVIPYGVDTKLFRPMPLPDEPAVLYYGTFQPHRSELLLKVVEELVRMRSDVLVYLIGDMPLSVAKRVKSLGGKVIAPGFVPHDELPKWLEKATVCLLPQDRSLGGRLSFKLLEYMACGRPVVATDVDESFPVKESGAGLVTPVDPEAMAQAVVKLLDNRSLCENLGKKGEDYARKFDWERMVDKYVRVLTKVGLDFVNQRTLR